MSEQLTDSNLPGSFHTDLQNPVDAVTSLGQQQLSRRTFVGAAATTLALLFFPACAEAQTQDPRKEALKLIDDIEAEFNVTFINQDGSTPSSKINGNDWFYHPTDGPYDFALIGIQTMRHVLKNLPPHFLSSYAGGGLTLQASASVPEVGLRPDPIYADQQEANGSIGPIPTYVISENNNDIVPRNIAVIWSANFLGIDSNLIGAYNYAGTVSSIILPLLSWVNLPNVGVLGQEPSSPEATWRAWGKLLANELQGGKIFNTKLEGTLEDIEKSIQSSTTLGDIEIACQDDIKNELPVKAQGRGEPPIMAVISGRHLFAHLAGQYVFGRSFALDYYKNSVGLDETTAGKVYDLVKQFFGGFEYSSPMQIAKK